MFLGYFKNDTYEEDLDQEMVFSLKYFFPKWKGFLLGNDLPSLSCRDALHCIDSLHKGFMSNYGDRFKKWRQDYMRFKRHIGMVRFLVVMEIWKWKYLLFHLNLGLSKLLLCSYFKLTWASVNFSHFTLGKSEIWQCSTT